MLDDNTLLIGTTRSDENTENTSALRRFQLVDSYAEDFEVNQRLDNIEAIVPLQAGHLLLGLGSMKQRGQPQLCYLNVNQKAVRRLIAVTDVEGLCQLPDGQIAYSNDELSIIFKISIRGGVYPYVHLFDPDDLAAITPDH